MASIFNSSCGLIISDCVLFYSKSGTFSAKKSESRYYKNEFVLGIFALGLGRGPCVLLLLILTATSLALLPKRFPVS